jgi:molecular chaperone DnaK
LIDYSSANDRILDESQQMVERVENFSDQIPGGADERLDRAREKLNEAQDLAERKGDPEGCKQAMENVFEAKRLLAQVRIEHLKSIREGELTSVKGYFDEHIRKMARPSEITRFDNLARTAQREIEQKSGRFEDTIDEMKQMNWQVLWRQDYFVVEIFQQFSGEEYRFSDKALFRQLVAAGSDALKKDDIENLRKVVLGMYGIRVHYQTGQDLMDIVNIL